MVVISKFDRSSIATSLVDIKDHLIRGLATLSSIWDDIGLDDGQKNYRTDLVFVYIRSVNASRTQSSFTHYKSISTLFLVLVLCFYDYEKEACLLNFFKQLAFVK